MPTLRMIGVHPEVCSRLFIQRRQTTSLSRTSTTNDTNNQQIPRRHRMPTPNELLSCPLDSLRMMDREGNTAYPVPLADAKRLKRDIAKALAVYNEQNPQQHCHIQQQTESLPRKRPRLMSVEDEMIQPQSTLSTGCLPLDQILTLSHGPLHRALRDSTGALFSQPSTSTGGLPFGYVMHIVGPPQSGKSQFLCHLMCQAHNIPGTSWWLTTGPTIPHATRLAQMVESMNVPNATKQYIMDHTRLVHVANEWEILTTLSELEQVLRQDNDNAESSKPSVLVIDSLGVFVFDAQCLRRISERLQYMARRFSLLVLVAESTGVNSTSYNNHKRWATTTPSRCWKQDLRLSFRRRLPNKESHDNQQQAKTTESKEWTFETQVILEQHPFYSETALPTRPKKSTVLLVTPQGVVSAS